MTRTFLIPCILLALLALPACNADSDSDSNSNNTANNESNNGGNNQTTGLSITHDGQTMAANNTMSTVNTFTFENKGTLSTTVIAGWANQALDAKFGTITLRLSLTGAPGQVASTGTFTFDDDEFTPQSARLTVENPELGLPTHLTAESGTLTVEAVELTGNSLTTITMNFEGTFKNHDETDTKAYDLSGSLKYKK